ncbi:transposase [Embleya sp. MST-111070]|uniref:transposase n=1 Tax=Embleya sp. MST-111070 TaxID=3398231 RepID=UPI003F73EF21
MQRQYTGTAGHVENSRVGALPAYATSRGRVLIDRRPHLPEHPWRGDPERRHAAGIPDNVRFATKPRLAQEPGPQPDLVAPTHHPRHARPDLPCSHRRRSGRPQPAGRTHHLARNLEPLPPTVPEIRRPLAIVFGPPGRSATGLLHRSTWRRRHQTPARHSHETSRPGRGGPGRAGCLRQALRFGREVGADQSRGAGRRRRAGLRDLGLAARSGLCSAKTGRQRGQGRARVGFAGVPSRVGRACAAGVCAVVGLRGWSESSGRPPPACGAPRHKAPTRIAHCSAETRQAAAGGRGLGSGLPGWLPGWVGRVRRAFALWSGCGAGQSRLAGRRQRAGLQDTKPRRELRIARRKPGRQRRAGGGSGRVRRGGFPGGSGVCGGRLRCGRVAGLVRVVWPAAASVRGSKTQSPDESCALVGGNPAGSGRRARGRVGSSGEPCRVDPACFGGSGVRSRIAMGGSKP